MNLDRLETSSGRNHSSIIAILIMAIFSIGIGAEATPFSTECLGSETKLQIIYLHGIFQGNEASPPIEYRDDLKKLSTELPIRIAVPRSNLLCKASKDRYCWGSDQPPEIEKIYKNILESTGACIDTKKSFGIIGFSNGGYHATRAALRCLQPQAKFVVAIGSSGDPKLAASNDLSRCPMVNLLIGKRDMTKDKAQRFFNSMAPLKLPMTFATFDGGHQLPVAELRKFLKNELGK